MFEQLRIETTLEFVPRGQQHYWSAKFKQGSGENERTLMEIQSDQFDLKNEKLFASLYENTCVRAMKEIKLSPRFAALLLPH